MTKVITRPKAAPVSKSTNKLAGASESWLDYLPLVQDRADALLDGVSRSYIDADNETLYRLPRIALKTLQSIRAELAREKVDEAIYDASALIVAAMTTAEVDSPAFTSLHQALDLVHGLMYAHEPNTRLRNFDEVKKALAVTPATPPAAEHQSIQHERSPNFQDEEDERLSITMEALCEQETLLRTLRRLRDDEDIVVLVSSISSRLIDLTSVVMSTLGNDDDRKTKEMYLVVHGEEA